MLAPVLRRRGRALLPVPAKRLPGPEAGPALRIQMYPSVAIKAVTVDDSDVEGID